MLKKKNAMYFILFKPQSQQSDPSLLLTGVLQPLTLKEPFGPVSFWSERTQSCKISPYHLENCIDVYVTIKPFIYKI